MKNQENENKLNPIKDFFVVYGWAILSAVIVLGSLISYFYFNQPIDDPIKLKECLESKARSFCLDNNMIYIYDKVNTYGPYYFMCYENERSYNSDKYKFLESEINECEEYSKIKDEE